MVIGIKPLTPGLSGDYFDFFENRAFTDDSPYRCYCQLYQMTEAQAKAECDNVPGLDPGAASRRVAAKQIDAGVLRGYLAFVNGVAIGWCNANDLANYPAGSRGGARFQWSAGTREQGRVKIVACFEIAPEYRMKGVATALLARVCADAKTDGYAAVEGFPFVRAGRYEWDCGGPVRLYEKAGFAKVAERDGAMVMRKAL